MIMLVLVVDSCWVSLKFRLLLVLVMIVSFLERLGIVVIRFLVM